MDSLNVRKKAWRFCKMTNSTLFIGSSLTNGFRSWYSDPKLGDERPAGFVNGHGGFWLPEFMVTARPYYIRGSSFFLPKTFVIEPVMSPITVMPIHANGHGVTDHGHEIEINIDSYEQIVFTVPMLFWDVSNYWLYRQKRGLFNEETKTTFEDENLTEALSEQDFLKIHKDRFSIAYSFLEDVRKITENLPIWISPAVLPSRARPEYSAGWKRLYWAEMRSVDRALSKLFGTLPMEQPLSTLDDDMCTKEEFMQDDQHHYNAQFVQELIEVYGF